jgi:hypothetical protein
MAFGGLHRECNIWMITGIDARIHSASRIPPLG